MNDDAGDEWWLMMYLFGLHSKMFQNVRQSFPSDYEWGRWWMTMNEDEDGDDVVFSAFGIVKAAGKETCETFELPRVC